MSTINGTDCIVEEGRALGVVGDFGWNRVRTTRQLDVFSIEGVGCKYFEHEFKITKQYG